MRNDRLSFAMLDDLMVSMEMGKVKTAREATAQVQRGDLGAFMEYVCLESQGMRVPISFVELPFEEVAHATKALHSTDDDDHDLHPRALEFRKCPSNSPGFRTPGWMAFVKRLERAAAETGFPVKFAQGITGAFVEMADNVVMHSDAVHTGLAAYRSKPSQFEFVVADSGIGVLASLRKCVDYVRLTDHGDALLRAVTQGASRFGASSGHGHGFRNLFIRLAEEGGTLRFRSGDHALVVDGEKLGHSTTQRLQRPLFSGFLVSVCCTCPRP